MWVPYVFSVCIVINWFDLDQPCHMYLVPGHCFVIWELIFMRFCILSFSRCFMYHVSNFGMIGRVSAGGVSNLLFMVSLCFLICYIIKVNLHVMDFSMLIPITTDGAV